MTKHQTKDAHLMTFHKTNEVRGVVHEYWIERRRARMQGRKAASSGEGGPAGAQGLSRKKFKKSY